MLEEDVHFAFELVHVALLDARDLEFLLVLLEDTEIGAQMEELVLDAPQRGREARVDARSERHADDAVQLVDRSESLDPERVLRDFLPAAEVRVASVADLRGDFGDAHAD